MWTDVGSLSVNTAQMWTNTNVKATLSLRQSLSDKERARVLEDWCKLEKHPFIHLVVFKKSYALWSEEEKALEENRVECKLKRLWINKDELQNMTAESDIY